MTNMKNTIILFIGLALTMACQKAKVADEEQQTAEIKETMAVLSEVQTKNAGIEIGQSVEKEIALKLRLNGIIDVPPQNLVSVSAPLGGYLKSTKLLTGTHVRKGEVLAVLEDNQYIELQQEYLTGTTKMAFLENELIRQKELNRNQAASDKVLQQVEMDFRTQQVMNQAVREKLLLAGINPKKVSADHISRSINILSPINGYVSHVNVNIGKYVMPQDVLFELVNPQDIHLGLRVFEKDLDKIKVGQKVIAYTNANPDKKYECEVILIGKDLTRERTAEVHSHFESYDQALIPGMYMNAEIELKRKKASLIPENAVVSYEGKTYIFIPKGKNTFEMTEVTVGETKEGLVAITDLPSPDQKLVIKGAYALLMFLKNKAED